MSKIKITTDGNGAASHVAYNFTDVAAIYPITPSSTMAENVDEWATLGRKNVFDQEVRVTEMQSEGGAAGAVHGALSSGALTTTFTASQGLLLMIPNMYKIAGELLPCVFHVSARSLATHALSIFGDHSDVMACRQTGFAMLASGSVQEVADLSIVSHIATLNSRIPFVNFFDGFRTSHEIQKIEVLELEDYKKMIPMAAVEDFRRRGLNPEHPIMKGSAQNPDIYFQGREASNIFYNELPKHILNAMDDVSKATGRKYRPFMYYGDPEASDIIVAMGSVTEALEETVDFLNSTGEKVGIVKVHLYRPFLSEEFLKEVPKSVTKIAVLDRTKEPGANGEPLYKDICSAYYGRDFMPKIVGGRYGLGSKDVTPGHLISVFNNMKDEMKNGFTLGIIDDVTNTSLPFDKNRVIPGSNTINCKFWGLGSDGTVGANKSAIKIIGDNTDLFVQGYFSYDSKKSGGITISHLRFGDEKIRSTYLIKSADFISCSQTSYLEKYDVCEGLKEGGTFLLNTSASLEEANEILPNKIKRQLALKKVNLVFIDANKVAKEVGLGHRINMVMQTAFFSLSNVLEIEKAIGLLKSSIEKTYGKKGKNIVELNNEAVDRSISKLIRIPVEDSWKHLKDINTETNHPKFIKDVCDKINSLNGDELPVSVFNGREDGSFPLGTAAFEKRGIATDVPRWISKKCIQCNQCSFVCPHSVIRPFLLEEKETVGFNGDLLEAKGKNLSDLKFRIQVSPLDCTGCENCVHTCPVGALEMSPLKNEIDEKYNWLKMLEVSSKKDKIGDINVKSSQFLEPFLEFSGACAGCGETPYIKTVTQLFGDQMIIANATGCSSIWGASAPSMPYCTNKEGRGPAWANSLFEDNAEFGNGILMGVAQRRRKLGDSMKSIIEDVTPKTKGHILDWLTYKRDTLESMRVSKELVLSLAEEKLFGESDKIRNFIIDNQDMLAKKSIWLVGGDGWAYDIGYGGLDHVLASGADVNVLVFDTEIYSNTGGQASKATPLGAIAKFAAGGKRFRKKDLGIMQMTYGHVYVAQVAMGANKQQYLKAVKEAESFKGPSLIICYAPCISQGLKGGLVDTQLREKEAVDSGYWHLYRYNPELKERGENPFILDSKEPTGNYREYILKEVRFSSLSSKDPKVANCLYAEGEKEAEEKYSLLRSLAKGDVIF